MKQWIKVAGLSVLLAVSVMAQSVSQGGNGNYNPVNTAWWVYALVYGMYAAIIGSAILWHCAHGALGSHDGFAKIFNTIIFGAIGFGAVFIITNMVTGRAAPVIP